MHIEEFMELYRKGVLLQDMNLKNEELDSLIESLVKDNTGSSGYSENLHKIIADRDRNGIRRTHIAKELGISNRTIKKCCEKYGIPNKSKSDSSLLYEMITYDTNIDGQCLDCGENLNDLTSTSGDIGEFYCMSCGNEYKVVEGEGVYQLRWEFMD